MSQPVILNVKMKDEASQVAQSSSEKIKDSFGAAFLEVSEKSKDFSEDFKDRRKRKPRQLRNNWMSKLMLLKISSKLLLLNSMHLTVKYSWTL